MVIHCSLSLARCPSIYFDKMFLLLISNIVRKHFVQILEYVEQLGKSVTGFSQSCILGFRKVNAVVSFSFAFKWAF